MGTLNNKNILIIGASGKTGSIVLKDLLSLDGVNIYATSRTHDGIINHIDGAITVDYDKRYDNLDMYDAVISATSSPHIVLKKQIKKRNKELVKDEFLSTLQYLVTLRYSRMNTQFTKILTNLTEIADQQQQN